MKIVWAILIILTVSFQYRIWFSDASFLTLSKTKLLVETQEAENSELRVRNDELAAEVADLKSGNEAYEERARVELGMIGPNETFIQVIQPDS